MYNIDMSQVGQVNYTWDFDQDEYDEWLEEEEMPNSNESLMSYIDDCVGFDLEFFDNETFHEMDNMYDVPTDGLSELFGDKMRQKIITDCMNNGEGSFETYEMYDDDIDINNPEELNDAAMKLLQHGDYYKDCRGFILSNGIVVYTPNEHNQCTIIDGVENTFHFVRLGNIRVLQNSIDIGGAPTNEQRNTLRKVIAAYSDGILYLDIFEQNGGVVGTQYNRPTYNKVMGDIDRYYREGIKPTGNIHENKKNKRVFITEQQFIQLMTEEYNNKVIYTAQNVDNPDELMRKYPSELPNKYYHHSTNKFGKQPFDEREGERMRLHITGRLTNDKVDALTVENPNSTNNIPHITLATANGVRPVESNTELERHLNDIIPLDDYVDTTFRNNFGK